MSDTKTTAPLSSHVEPMLRGIGFDLDELHVIARLYVRVRVHHDTAYAFQSWAKAEVWSAATLSWHELWSVPAAVWADDSAPEAPGTCGMWAARDELLATVHTLLDEPVPLAR